jgi:hypothetical protein
MIKNPVGFSVIDDKSQEFFDCISETHDVTNIMFTNLTMSTFLLSCCKFKIKVYINLRFNLSARLRRQLLINKKYMQTKILIVIKKVCQ